MREGRREELSELAESLKLKVYKAKVVSMRECRSVLTLFSAL